MIYFVGAGPGAEDLITVRGERLLREADCIIYAGSLVNPALLRKKKKECVLYDSATMTLDAVLSVMRRVDSAQKVTVRLHSGDPCLYGAVREQMDALDALGIAYRSVPGVSSLCAAAAVLQMEYTLPGVSQSVVITRLAGRTPVPERERLRLLAYHQTSMVVFLSAGMMGQVQEELLAGGYAPETPAAIVYKASWPDERTYTCTVQTLAQTAHDNDIRQTALVIVGQAVAPSVYGRSCLYAPDFATGFRSSVEQG